MNHEPFPHALLKLEDEWPHPPGPDSAWQESVFFTMQDADTGVAATIRIGHEPNNGVGHCCFSISTSHHVGYQRSHRDIPFNGNERVSDGFAIDDFLTASFSAGTSRWRASDEECDIDLTFTDLHPLYEIFRLMGEGAMSEVERGFTSNSLAMAGRVTGTVRIGETTWQVNGTGSRDHSWGNRHVGVLANWVWLTGGFESDLYFAVGSLIARTGELRPGGFILQGGRRGLVTNVDIVLGAELDGVTTREARLVVNTDELGTFAFDAVGFAPNMLLDLGATYLETFLPCVLTYEGQTTTASLGVGLNPRGGEMPVPRFLNAVHENGITTI